MTSAASLTPGSIPRRGGRATVVLSLGLLILLMLSAWRLVLTEPEAMIHEFRGATMGTTYVVKIDAALADDQRSVVAETIDRRLGEIDRLMSTYDPASEVSRFNRHASTTPFVLSPPTLEVLSIAREVSDRSGGALDVTVAPLVDAWGFGPEGRPVAVPSDEVLSRLRDRVGYEKISVDSEAGTVAKQHPGTVVDLSAVAKGYGVDVVADALSRLGVTRFLVEVGGELKALGRKRDGTPWRVGIEQPDPARRTVSRALDLVDGAVATSGDYRNFYDDDGVRYAHIIDPRIARPIRYAGTSVTVFHASAATADAWATALSVLGPEEGYDLAERESVAALFIVQAEGVFRARETGAFRARQSQESRVSQGGP